MTDMPDTLEKVVGALGFSEPASFRPRFHANDTSGDVLNVAQREAVIANARAMTPPPSLDIEGFTLVPHTSAVEDFRDLDAVQRVHPEEIRRLLLDLTGADHVEVRTAAILRFGEKSKDSGALDNSRPARFVHIDISDATAAAFNAQTAPPEGRRIRRAAQYNVWRVLTPPPQDVPLAVCDARTIAADDLIPADAIFDKDGQVLFSFEALLLRYNPKQRWAFFADMRPDEALVFKTNDTDPRYAHHVPHGAFDNPACPPDAPPRASVEMRGTAFWYD